MANATKLKEQARQLEQKDQWKDALQLYERIVEESESDDSGLWNRIGDLQVRLGQPDAAVEAYDRAVEAYVDAGLHNNAIALCNKILRIAPTRNPVYLRLGQISAAQGFLADARHSFLQYAERMQQAGEEQTAFAALREFADLAPEDIEVRRALAEQLRARGLTNDAVEQMRIVARQLRAQGRAAEADRVSEEIRELDPQAATESSPEGDAGSGGGRRAFAEEEEDDEFGLLPTFELSHAPARPAPNPANDDADLSITAPDDLQTDHFESADLEADDLAAGAALALDGFQPTHEEPSESIPLAADATEDLLLEIRIDGDDAEATYDPGQPTTAEPEPDREAETATLLEGLDSWLPDEVAEPADELRTDFVSPSLEEPTEGESIPVLEGFEATGQDQDEEWEEGDNSATLPLLADSDVLPSVSAADAVPFVEEDQSADADDLSAGDESLPLIGSFDGVDAEISSAEHLDGFLPMEPDEPPVLADRFEAADLPLVDSGLAEIEPTEFDPLTFAPEEFASAERVADDDSSVYEEGSEDFAFGEFAPEEQEEQAAPLFFEPSVPAAPAVPLTGDALDVARERFAANPLAADARDELMDLLQRNDLSAEAESVLEQAHRALGAEDRFAEALVVVGALLESRPEDTALYQKQVEYAFRCGDREQLIGAYLALAEHLREGGNAEKSATVYQRVLDLEPGHEAARRGLEAVRPAPPSATTDGGYVDLAALILEDEAPPASTRFVVPEEEPSGDEARDFADMLSLFRQKVAENISVEDSASHYDLGLAFKDMGLLDEAIAQFQVALRGGANPLATLEVLGECFVEKGQFTLATRVLERALHLPGADDADRIGVFYWMGRCEEIVRQPERARDFYERVLALDIRFRDAAARHDALPTESGPPSL